MSPHYQLTTASLVSPIVTVPHAIAHPALVNALAPHPAMEVFLWTVFAVELIAEVRTVHDSIAHSRLLT